MRRKFVSFHQGEKLVEPFCKFRVFADYNRRKHFVEVYVWNHFWQLRSLRHRRKGKTQAFFHGYNEQRKKPDKNGRAVGSKKLGDIHFCIKRITYNIIAHEAYHATREYSRRCGHYEPQTEAEERASYTGAADSGEERNARFQGDITDAIISRMLDELKKKPQKAK